MNKILRFFLVSMILTTMVSLFSSCFSFKDSHKSIEKASKESRLENYKVFIVKKSTNDTISGKKWNIKVRDKAWYITIDNQFYIDNSVISFQSKYGLAVRFRKVLDSHSFIDQWAYYLKRGKINILSNETYLPRPVRYDNLTKTWNSPGYYQMGFYYELGDGVFHDLNTESLKQIISDNPEAMELFRKSKMSDNQFIFMEKALKIIDVYNKTK